MSDEETKRVALGDCECPKKPHGLQTVTADGVVAGGDWADCKLLLNYGDLRRLASAMANRMFDPTAYQPVLMKRGIVAWNKTDRLGHAILLDESAFDELSAAQGLALVHHFDSAEYSAQYTRFTGEAVTCAVCGRTSQRDDKFCTNCGAELAEPEAPPEADPPNPSSGPSADGSAATPDQVSSFSEAASTAKAASSSRSRSTPTAESSPASSPMSS